MSSARAKATGRIERLTDMIVDGIGDYIEMKKRLAEALAARDALDATVGEAEAVPEIATPPKIAEAYRRNVTRLVEALNAPELEAGDARHALRNLVELITAEPKADGRGVDLVVHERLAQILHIANDRPDKSPGGRMQNVVAGTGFDRDRSSIETASAYPGQGRCRAQVSVQVCQPRIRRSVAGHC